ncbi:Suppressor of lethality of KEX2 GAS1 double null mutant protein 1 [Bienertia sinuspersici]
MKTSLRSYKIRGLIELLQLCKSKTIGDHNNGSLNLQLAGARFVHDNAAATSGGTMGRDGQPPMSCKPPSPTPRPPPAGRLPWFKMLLGSMFSLLLAFWAPKWTTLLKIGGEAELVLKEVEQAAEVVEKVGTVVEKISEEVADQLPNDNKIKEAVLVAEHISQEAVKDAHIAEEIIHKVERVKQDLEDI